MKIPYLKITQKNETFYVTKFKASVLKDKLNFHFREPYSDNLREIEKYKDYINKLNRKGIEISADAEGVQRRLQISKINKIKKYLENEADSYFPTSVVLAADVSEDELFMNNYMEIEENDFGIIELSDDIMFQIVDGQHRLAGLFISDIDVQNDFEVPAVILFNATKHTCAKIFSDINGNQSTVNKSVIYDLYELMDPNEKNYIDNEQLQRIQSLHSICKTFNTDPKSPLYKHLKMLGVGNGAISQAFFIKYVDDAITNVGFDIKKTQSIYNQLFVYLKCFQRIFKNQWPVLEKDSYVNTFEFYDHSSKVLKEMKSQLLKTNGFGAIMMLFPDVYKHLESHDYDDYYQLISKLKSKIDWANDSILVQGTGKKNQSKMREKLISELGIKTNKK